MGLVGVIGQHGYAATAIVLFLAAVGLPLPASIALLAAGAAARQGGLQIGPVVLVGGLAAAIGDTLLYLGGRYTGWWLLAGLCRLSGNPEQCIFGSADYFYRRGPKTLLFAKFVPGLGAMAAPMAGSLNMRLSRFLRMDLAGAFIYCAAWALTGYLFSRFIENIIGWINRAGHLIVGLVLLAIFVYAITLLVFAIRARKYGSVERIPALALHERMQTEDPNRLVIIADVRSHSYYDPAMQRIKNSIRVEPSRLKEELVALREFMAPECEIYLYCSCIREATSVRVAYMMEQENFHTHVIEGGMRAWVKAGGAMEPVPEGEVKHLPRFD